MLRTALGLVVMSVAAAQITRCGPFFGMQACPYNADGLGTVEYCSRWGFCGTADQFKAQQTSGHYIYSRTEDGSVSPDDVCINRPDPDAFCNGILPGATCSRSDGRCEIFNIPASRLSATGNYELVVVRCGPFFQNMACPTNADGLGTVQYCSKFGFCGTSSDFVKAQAKGQYILSRTLDGSIDPADVCSDKPSPNQFCQQFHSNSTCNVNEVRCELNNINATSFQKFVPGVWTLPPYKTAKVSLAAGSPGSGSARQVSDNNENTSSASSLSAIVSLMLVAIAFLVRY